MVVIKVVLGLAALIAIAHAGPVSTSACESDEWQCNNGNCIWILSRCDGEDHCGDGSDESQSLCNSFPSTRLEDGQEVRVKIQYQSIYLGVQFTVANAEWDSTLWVMGNNSVGALGYTATKKYLPKVDPWYAPGNYRDSAWPLGSYNLPDGEYVFVVQRSPKKLTVWLQDSPSHVASVPLPADADSTLVIKPYNWFSDMDVQFEALAVPAA